MADKTNGSSSLTVGQAPVARTESVGSLGGDTPIRSRDSLKASLNDLHQMEDSGKVSYTKEDAGDAAVTIGPVEVAFSGMTKDELMKYANDPFWIRLRWALLILFWLAWLAMLGGAIAIIALAPKCPPPAPVEYWQKAPVYQVLPRSFQDGVANADGNGDIKGIIQRLGHIANLGAGVLWLSPIFKSPMADAGYDITDFRDVDPMFGTLQDFDELVSAAKEKDLEVVLDLVPNHSSDKHEWFIASEKRVDPYTDYYVWQDGREGNKLPPNNWLSVYGGSAWNFSETRGQWYLHQFLDSQPDLNYRNKAVLNELLDTVSFWLDRGVAGFRLHAVAHIFEDEAFADEPKSDASGAEPEQYEYLNHVFTRGMEENYGLVAKLRQIIQEAYESKDGKHRILMTEADVALEDLIRFYGNETSRLVDMPFNFKLIDQLPRGFTGSQLHKSVNDFIRALPSWAWPNWILGNENEPRVATRLGAELVDAMAMVQIMLPGTPVIYYGEEIGMQNKVVSWEETQDPRGCIQGVDHYADFSRDPARTPMQWDNSTSAGFSAFTGGSWLPVGDDYHLLNVQQQQEASTSHLANYRRLVELHKQSSVLYGETSLGFFDDDIFSFTRIRRGSPGYLVVVNVGSGQRTIDFSGNESLADELVVEVRSIQADPTIVPGMKMATNAIVVGPNEGLVLSFVPK